MFFAILISVNHFLVKTLETKHGGVASITVSGPDDSKTGEKRNGLVALRGRKSSKTIRFSNGKMSRLALTSQWLKAMASL
jgi:hypothetical protein